MPLNRNWPKKSCSSLLIVPKDVACQEHFSFHFNTDLFGHHIVFNLCICQSFFQVMPNTPLIRNGIIMVRSFYLVPGFKRWVFRGCLCFFCTKAHTFPIGTRHQLRLPTFLLLKQKGICYSIIIERHSYPHLAINASIWKRFVEVITPSLWFLQAQLQTLISCCTLTDKQQVRKAD